jgi:hypothetical protein
MACGKKKIEGRRGKKNHLRRGKRESFGTKKTAQKNMNPPSPSARVYTPLFTFFLIKMSCKK